MIYHSRKITMSKSLNKVILIGNVGGKVEYKEHSDKLQIANLNLATSEQYRDKNGDKNEKTEWHRVVLFNKLAQIAAEYIKKGTKLYVEGKIQTRKYTDKDGVEKYSTEIIANDFVLLSSVNTKENSAEQGDIPF